MKDVIGIDIGNEYAYVSFYKDGMDKPQTISPFAGSEKYAIPVEIARDASKREWVFGSRLMDQNVRDRLMIKKNLLDNAFEYVDNPDLAEEHCRILGAFFGYLFNLAKKNGVEKNDASVVLTTDKLDKKRAGILKKALYECDIKDADIYMVNHKESFFFFLANQTYDRWLHDVVLFEYNAGAMIEYYFTKNNSTKPPLVSITTGRVDEFTGFMDDAQKDIAFEAYLNKAFDRKNISTVYLVGDGFNGDWLNNSLGVLCKNRKVFSGKNLFTSGACYYPFSEEKRDMIYVGDSMMQCDFSMDIRVGKSKGEVNLINAGDNLYRSFCSCDILLDDEPSINIKSKKFMSSDAHINVLELSGMERRPAKATRVNLRIEPTDNNTVNVTIKDLGMGEIYPSSSKTWNFSVGE